MPEPHGPDGTWRHGPDWRPAFTGDTSLGDVGSGRSFGVDLYELYKAGRLRFPEVAATYSSLTSRVHRIAAPASHLFTVAGYTEPAHQLLLELRGELHEVLRRSSIDIRDAGIALVETADSYVATDEAAAEALAGKLAEHGEEFREPPPFVPDPPAHDAPPPSQPPGGRLVPD